MNIVPKQVFISFIRANPQFVSIPVEGYQIAVMQYADNTGKIVASAFYDTTSGKQKTTYRIAKS